MRRMCETPERARAEVQWDPTPPRPTMMTKEERRRASRGGVRKEDVRVSCSWINSGIR